jgi:ribulose-5-phosphate 4-epimerase/fuculose-1-phosphate aldolase
MSVTDIATKKAPETQQQLALEAAATTRLLEVEGILDYSGHVSIRIPGRDALLIQVGSTSRQEVTPANILVCDFDCNVIEGEGQPPSETVIHTEILKARPDVNAVLHCHMDLAIAFTMMQGVSILPMRARASRWKSGIPTHPDPSHIKFKEQGIDLAKTLGPHHVALMRAHGLVMTAESVRHLFVDAVHFKENALAQLQVMQSGAKPVALTEAEIEQIEAMEMRDWHVKKLWNYYVRKAMKEGRLPADWSALVPSKDALKRDKMYDERGAEFMRKRK